MDPSDDDSSELSPPCCASARYDLESDARRNDLTTVVDEMESGEVLACSDDSPTVGRRGADAPESSGCGDAARALAADDDDATARPEEAREEETKERPKVRLLPPAPTVPSASESTPGGNRPRTDRKVAAWKRKAAKKQKKTKSGTSHRSGNHLGVAASWLARKQNLHRRPHPVPISSTSATGCSVANAETSATVGTTRDWIAQKQNTGRRAQQRNRGKSNGSTSSEQPEQFDSATGCSAAAVSVLAATTANGAISTTVGTEEEGWIDRKQNVGRRGQNKDGGEPNPPASASFSPDPEVPSDANGQGATTTTTRPSGESAGRAGPVVRSWLARKQNLHHHRRRGQRSRRPPGASTARSSGAGGSSVLAGSALLRLLRSVTPGAFAVDGPLSSGEDSEAAGDGISPRFDDDDEQRGEEEEQSSRRALFIAQDTFLVEKDEKIPTTPCSSSHVRRPLGASVYDGVIVPAPPPATARGGEANMAPSSSRKRCLVVPMWIVALGVAFCAVLAAVTAVTITAARREESSGPSPSPPSRHEAVSSALAAALGDDYYAQSWNVEGSSQARALDWLAADDGDDDAAGPGSIDPTRDDDERARRRLVQRYVLAVLYFATEGEGWTEGLDFLSDGHECGWNTRRGGGGDSVVDNVFSLSDGGSAVPDRLAVAAPDFLGVECLRDNSTVNGIRINQNNMKGSLPVEMGFLPALEYLILSDNGISDTIPSAIGNLSDLRVLDLHDNELIGPVPAHLGRLRNLTVLWLENNELVGTIPRQIGELVNVEVLSLGHNLLYGTVPSAFGNLSGLIRLHLQNNRLSGTIPSTLFQPERIERIILFSNYLSGTIPSDVGNMRYAKGIELYDNQLSGTIPPEVGRLRNLETLLLSVNPLNGTIPKEMGQLVNLRIFGLIISQLSGTLPPEMGNMTRLTQLILDSNMFSGTVPITLSKLESLRWLSVTNTSLTGNLTVFCDESILLLASDCYGNSPEVVCACCGVCCSDTDQGPVNLWEQFAQPSVRTVEAPPGMEHWNCFWGDDDR